MEQLLDAAAGLIREAGGPVAVMIVTGVLSWLSLALRPTHKHLRELEKLGAIRANLGGSSCELALDERIRKVLARMEAAEARAAHRSIRLLWATRSLAVFFAVLISLVFYASAAGVVKLPGVAIYVFAGMGAWIGILVSLWSEGTEDRVREEYGLPPRKLLSVRASEFLNRWKK